MKFLISLTKHSIFELLDLSMSRPVSFGYIVLAILVIIQDELGEVAWNQHLQQLLLSKHHLTDSYKLRIHRNPKLIF